MLVWLKDLTLIIVDSQERLGYNVTGESILDIRLSMCRPKQRMDCLTYLLRPSALSVLIISQKYKFCCWGLFCSLKRVVGIRDESVDVGFNDWSLIGTTGCLLVVFMPSVLSIYFGHVER